MSRDDSRRLHLDPPFDYEDLPPTGRSAVVSMPPDQRHFAAWVVRTMETQKQQRPSEPPLKKTKDLVEWVRWALTIVLGIAAVGWFAKEYVGQFQTKEEAKAVQQEIAASSRDVQSTIATHDDELEVMRVNDVRFDLQMRSLADRMDALIALSGAETPAERREAARHAVEVERQISTRERYLRDPQTLRRLAEDRRRDPYRFNEGP